MASLGSLPVTRVPFVRTPLHASGNQLQSQSAWAPYLAAEKPASLVRPGPSFAIQPMSGTVIIGSAPPWRESAMKLSAAAPAVALPPGMLWKYQSAPLLSAFSCQLYRVTELPPQRWTGAFSAWSCSGVAQLTP